MDKRKYEEIKNQYGPDYHSHSDALKLRDRGGWFHFEAEVEKYVIPYIVPGNVMVAGCGIGHQVWALRQHNWDAYGCDIGWWAIEHTLAPGRCFVFDLAIDDYNLMPYDNVLALDVLEHIPIEFLDRAILNCKRMTGKLFMARVPWREGYEKIYDSSGPVQEHYIVKPPGWWMHRIGNIFVGWKTELIGKFFNGDDRWGDPYGILFRWGG